MVAGLEQSGRSGRNGRYHRAGPCHCHIRVGAAACGGNIERTHSLAGNHGDLNGRRLGIRSGELCGLTQRRKLVGVHNGDDRQRKRVAEADKPGGFRAAVRADDILITDHAHRRAVDQCQTGNSGGAVLRAELHVAAVIHNRIDDIRYLCALLQLGIAANAKSVRFRYKRQVIRGQAAKHLARSVQSILFGLLYPVGQSELGRRLCGAVLICRFYGKGGVFRHNHKVSARRNQSRSAYTGTEHNGNLRNHTGKIIAFQQNISICREQLGSLFQMSAHRIVDSHNRCSGLQCQII